MHSKLIINFKHASVSKTLKFFTRFAVEMKRRSRFREVLREISFLRRFQKRFESYGSSYLNYEPG